MRMLRASAWDCSPFGGRNWIKMRQIKAGVWAEIQWSFGADPGADGAAIGSKLPNLVKSKTDLRTAKKTAGRAPNMRSNRGNLGLRISTARNYLLNVV